MDKINPLLYTYVPNLSTIEVCTERSVKMKLVVNLSFSLQTLRKDVLQMTKYLDQCELAKESGVTKLLDSFPHFKDTAKQFSMTDMELIRDGQLLPQLQRIHQAFTNHIRQTCKV